MAAAMTPGTRLGPYELGSLLGAGSMGEVYRALDSRLGRTVAVKILPPEAATPARLRQFEREARAASALNHPNILTIHDVGREGDVAYVAMEWVEGQTLRSLMGASHLSIRRVVELAAQVAEGLAKAHAAGIVHRDIKPENVMVSDDGFVKIVDFGLATPAAETPSRADGVLADVTRTATATAVTGTVGYMSPEQASGHPVDHRSDQFSLGVLLYEMATRTRPFERATTAQSLVATIEAEPPPVETVNREVPPPLATVIGRCLAKAPRDRYDSTRDLARDLQGIVESLASSTGAGRMRWPTWRWMALATGTAMLAAFAVTSTSRPAGPFADQAEPPLVAVRAIRPVSDGDAPVSFAAGITQELHSRLSQVSGLRLLSRSAVNRYANGDAARMAVELGVEGVVEGDLRVDASAVHLEARLIDLEGRRAVWTASYERDRDALLTVPGEVAEQLVKALSVAVTPEERARLRRRPTAVLDAYLLYLQWQRTREDWDDRDSQYASLEPLRRAIARDPAFVEARAAYAYELAGMGMIYEGGEQYLADAAAHADEALRLDSDSADAHDTLAVVHHARGHAGLARLPFQRGIAADPNDGSSLNNLSILEVGYGGFSTALDLARRAWALSGRRANDYYHVGAALSVLRDDDATARFLLDGERRFPASPRVQQLLALQEVLTGRPADAVARAKRSVEAVPDNPEGIMALSEIAYLVDSPELEALTAPLMKDSAGAASLWVGPSARTRYAYALSRRGDTRRAAALWADAEHAALRRIDAGDEMPIWRTELGAIAALRGRDAVALDWLGRAYDAGSREYGLLERDPAFATLRGHARFLSLLDSMRRDVAAQRQAAREKGLLDIDALLRIGQRGNDARP